MDDMKLTWLYMLEPPWRHSGPMGEQRKHGNTWLLGWTWTIAGLALGAIVAPSVVQFVGLSNTSYQDWLLIGVTVLAGFLVQILGWFSFSLLVGPVFRTRWTRRVDTAMESVPPLLKWTLYSVLMTAMLGVLFVAMVLPIAGVVYAIYRYLSWVGPGQQPVTIAFAGGLLLKAFIIPAITGAIQSKAFKWFMNWLRGGKGKATKSA